MHTSYVSASPRRPILIILVFLLILSEAGPLRSKTNPAQGLHFRLLGRDQGLQAGVVFCVMEDRQGYIWLGTRFGLKRYDGYEFRSYDGLPSDSANNLSGPITSICEDSSGMMWIVVKGGGLASLDRRTNKVTSYQNDPKDPTSLSATHIIALHVDAYKKLWAISQLWEMNRYDPSHDRFIKYAPPAGLTPEAVGGFSMLPEVDGKLLLAREAKFSFNLRDNTFQRLAVRERHQSLRIIGQAEDSMWLATTQDSVTHASTYLVLNSRMMPLQMMHLTGASSSSRVVSDQSGRTLLLTQKGLYVLNLSSGVVHRVWVPGLLQPSCLYVDRSGRIWIGGAAGLYLCDGENKKFYGIQLTTSTGQATAVRAIHAIGGEMQAGDLYGSLYRWDPVQRIFESLAVLRKSVDDRTPYSLHEINGDHHDRWLYAANSAPSFRYTSKGEREPVPPIDNTHGYAVCEDALSTIWIGSYAASADSTPNGGCLLHYDPATKALRRYRLSTPRMGGICAEYVFSLFEDRHKQLWIGSSAGLFKYDRARDTCIPVLHPRCDGSGHAANNIWVIFEDSRDRLWLGSWGRGLHLFDRKTNAYTDFTTKDGLPNNSIQSILEDDAGNLWIGTSRGLSRFNPETKVFTNFGVSDGLPDDEFQPKAATKLASGEMFFGAIGGITSFFPATIKPRDDHSPVVITSLHVSGKEMGQLAAGETIHLDYENNDIVFEYATLDYSANDRKRYEYMLVGLDDDWVHAGNRRTASYNNIPPGEYRLRVRGSDGNGTTPGNEMQIYVSVAPPYWETWWFRLVVGLSIVGTASIVAMRRLRGQQEQHLRIERAREKERMELAGDIHDGPLQDLYATRFLLDDENSALAQLLITVRGDLRSISSVLQPPKLQSGLVEELDILLQAFRQRCPDTAFELSTTGTPLRLPEGVGRNIFRIVRTALTNVQKHSKASSCKVDVKFSAKALQLSIRDNGVGFDTTTLDQLGREHFGLFLMKCYAKEIKAAISIDAFEGKGTEIDIRWRPNRFRFIRTRPLQKLQYNT